MPYNDFNARTFAALHEDTDKGWVWLGLKPNKDFRTRMTIKISRGNRFVYCEFRDIDSNFVRQYDANDDTTSMYFGTTEKDHAKQKELAKQARLKLDPVALDKLGDIVVLSGWYRDALGGFETWSSHWKSKDPDLYLQKLRVSQPWSMHWADLRAACQHPEPGVRVATRVAILGAWLGVAGLLAALIEVDPLKNWLENHVRYPNIYALATLFLFGVVCLFAGRGVQPPD